MSLRWVVRPQDLAVVRRICEVTGLPPVVAQVLAMRGMTRVDAIEAFLDLRMTRLLPPASLPGIGEAVRVIGEAIRAGRKLAVYGDYDCDGMTATAILVRALRLLGADVTYFIPNRVDDGYGLNEAQIRRLAARGAQCLVSVDCGVASVPEVAVARELGMQVVITDHHQAGPVLPDADAIVHPGLPGGTYPDPHLCGAGVAFELAWALLQDRAGSDRLPDPMKQNLFRALPLAAVGTVADVVSMTGQNRILVHHGLKLLPAYAVPGLLALMRVASLAKRPAIATDDVAFALAPRLNAAGRLGSAQLGAELLITDDAKRADELVEYIDNLNRSRTSLERSMMIEARKLIEADGGGDSDPAIVVAGRGWNPGMIGIIAGRLAEKHGRPVVVLSSEPVGGGPLTGSARGVPGIDLHAALDSCREWLVKFGGHRQAAGLQVLPGNVGAFRAAFLEAISCQTGGQPEIAALEIDVEVPLCQLTVESVQQLERLAPFGAGNPRPLMCASGLELVGEPKPMGADGRHLCFSVRQDESRLRCVAFGKADWDGPLRESASRGLDLAFRPVVNDFSGFPRVELQLVDWRAARLGRVASA